MSIILKILLRGAWRRIDVNGESFIVLNPPGYARAYRADDLAEWIKTLGVVTAEQLLEALDGSGLEEVDLFPAAA
jgi:hypothetical protein